MKITFTGYVEKMGEGFYWAKCLEIPVKAYGTTLTEVHERLDEAVHLYLKNYNQIGLNAIKEDRKNITLIQVFFSSSPDINEDFEDKVIKKEIK